MCKGAVHTKRTWKIARLLVPCVKQHLPNALRELGMKVPDDLTIVEPLKIQSADSQGLSNFKEVWVPSNCLASTKNTGLYEASGNLMWMDMMIAGGHEVPLQEPIWSVVLEYVADFFSETAAERVKGQQADRLIFPLTLDGYVTLEEHLYAGGAAHIGKTYPVRLILLIGHTMVVAWYFAMANALKDNNRVLIKMLWQAALTVTIRVRMAPQVDALLRASMLESEKFRGFEKMSDNFLTFADKITLLGNALKDKSAQKQAEKYAADGLKFAGTAMNKQMVLTVQALQAHMSDALRQCIVDLDTQFGRDVLSASYTKLNRVMAVTKAMAPTVGATTAEDNKSLLLFVCQMMGLTLQLGQVKSSFFTIAVLDNSKNGTVGWTAMTCTKFATFRHLDYLVRCIGLPDEFIQKYTKAYDHPVSFASQFPSLLEDLSAETTESASPHSPADDEPDVFGTFCEGMNKLQMAICTLAHSLYMGERDADLKTLAADANPLATLQKLDPETDSDLCAAFREIMKLASNSQTIAAATGSAPAMSLRALVRMQSDPDSLETSRAKDDEERSAMTLSPRKHAPK